jgi:mannose-6-phosphate isomerase-like protein (cupin superfamily)
MDFSRRDLSALLPGLLMTAEARGADNGVLPSKCYPFDSLPLKTNPKTHNETRQVFTGKTHDGYPIDLHITQLAPGQMPHPPHTHVHEEMIMLQTGTLEVTIKSQSTKIGPGSVAYVNSNELHGWKNVGSGPAQYFVLAIGRQQST